MDTQSSLERTAPAPNGGAVEPANRATVAKEKYQTPHDAPRVRYEVGDPFAEVTYRANSFVEMAAKADQLGSSRIVKIDSAGRRTTVNKVNGEWPEDREKAAPPDRAPGRDQAPTDQSALSPSRSSPRQAESPPSGLPQIDAKAEQALLAQRLEAALGERYIIKRASVSVGDVSLGRTEYRFRGDTSRVAFTESTFRLATDTNSPSVARSMVDVAQARNWRALRVSGHDDFKRLVWLEASARGVKTLGYEPSRADLDLLRKEIEARLVNRIEVAQEAGAGNANAHATASEKSSSRGGGRKAVLAAIEAVLVAKKVPEVQRQAVMEAATEKLAQRIRDGQALKVKVYDKTAPSQRTTMPPSREVQEMQRTRERPAQVR